HPARDCAFDEIETCVRIGKDDEVALRAQGASYRAAGLPAHAGLWEATLMVRRHHDPKVVETMEAWWSEYGVRSRRDQVSLAWIAWKTGVPIRTLPVRSLPGRPAPSPIYKLGNHHHRRKPGKRFVIALREWLLRCRTHLRRRLWRP
ncbi:MAG: hypothetical protein ACREUE_15995, partial [Panacagrimonas sp.]